MKKAILLFIGSLVLTLCFARLYVPNASLTNAANKFAVISIANISNEKAAPVFENAGVKAEVLADGNRFFLYIEDVGNSWNEKTFEIRSSEAGEIEIVLSGAYEGLLDSPTIFIDWRNLTIDGEAVFDGEKTGRNDRAGLAFKQKVASGQVLKVGVEYRNGITYASLISHTNLLGFWVVFAIIYFVLIVVFNIREAKNKITINYFTERINKNNIKKFLKSSLFASRVCKTAILIFVIISVYFILQEYAFGRIFDDHLLVNYSVRNILDIADVATSQSRFYPLHLIEYAFLRYTPFGYGAQAFYFVNALFFILFVFLLIQLFGISAKQKASYIYLKTLLIILFPFFNYPIVYSFLALIFPEMVVCIAFAGFILAYKKAYSVNFLINGGGGGGFNPITLNIKKTLWYLIALFFVVIATYKKEPVFGVFCIIAVINFLFAKDQDKIDKYFNFALILNGIAFLSMWFFNSFSLAGSWYNSASIVSKIPFAVFKNIPFFSLILIFAIFRAFYIMVKKDKEHIFYDGLLFASVGYGLVYLFVFKYDNPYYYSPMAVLFLPVLLYWILYFYNKKYFPLVVIVLLFLLGISFNGFQKSKNVVLQEYDIAKIFQYNLIKLDMYAKDNSPILLLRPDADSKFVQYDTNIILIYLNYLNSKFFIPKAHSKAEIFKTDYSIEDVDVSAPVDERAIYIVVDIDDMSKIDAKFSNFVNIAYLDAPSAGNVFYVFVYKDRI